MPSVPVPDDLRARLRAVVAELGERSASKQLGISRQTIYRVLAGLGCYPGTTAQLDARLPSSGDPS